MQAFAEILVVAWLILMAGALTAAETALLTARRKRLEEKVAEGSGSARVALALADEPNRFLPTVQAGGAILLILASAYASLRIAPLLMERFAGGTVEFLARHSEAYALAVVVLSLSIAWVLLADLLPKRLAMSNAEGVAMIAAFPLHWLCLITWPVVWLSGAVVQAASAGLRRRQLKLRVSVSDIEHLIRAGTTEGVLGQAEQRMASRALYLGQRSVREIMRPRIEIDAIDVDTPTDEVIGCVAMAGFSRLPVHEGDLDHIIGFVYTKDLLRQLHMGWPIELRKLVRPALLVPETLRIDKLLELFRQKRTQMALVLDEFGGTEGLVTMEDVLQELVGEIHDEWRTDQEQRMVRRDDGSWLVDGSVGLDDLLEHLGLENLRSATPRGFSTVAGLVISLLGRIPRVADRAAWECLSLEVVDMDGPRVDRLLVTVNAK